MSAPQDYLDKGAQPRKSRRVASLAKIADLNGVSYATVRNRVADGSLPALKLPGHKGWFADVDEASALFAKRAQWGSFGPDARLHDLSNHVDLDIEVIS